MPEYRLVSTRRNRDGSFDTPSIDETLTAPDDKIAIWEADHFPIDQFVEHVDVAWLIDMSGRVLWSFDAALPKAA